MNMLESFKDWIAYRLKLLDLIELKLRRMRRIAIMFRDGKVNARDRKTLEAEFHRLKDEVSKMDR